MKTIMIQPGVPIPARHQNARVDRYDLLAVLPEHSSPCSRCGVQELNHLWQVDDDGDTTDCAVLAGVCEVTAEFLLSDAARVRVEVACWPTNPTPDSEGRWYWAATAENVEANPAKVQWVRVDYAERDSAGVTWTVDGWTCRKSLAYSLVVRPVTS